MREMKDSRVEWIGEIPSTWNTCMVKNIFTITRGRVIAKTEIEENPLDNYYPVYSSQTANSGVLGYIPSFDYAVDSLTWTTDGAKAGTVFLRRGKYSITNVCGILTPKADDCVLEYLYYAVGYSANNCRRADINGFKIMSNEMAVIPLAIPPVEEQKRISTFLLEQETKVDTLVANVQTQIEKLKAYKQSLITEVVTKGLDPTVPMKDSGVEWIGEIPAHWGVTRIKNMFELWNERNDEADLTKVNLISLYTDLGVVQHSDLTATTGNRAVTAEGYKIVRKHDIVVNIILCWMGAVGMSQYDGVTSPAYDIYRPLKDTNSEYYHYLFRTNRFNGECYRYGRGIMMMRWRTYSTEFRAINIPCPPAEEQKKIVTHLNEKCNKIDQLIAIKQAKIEKLEQYKRSLIYEYVTGKKEVC